MSLGLITGYGSDSDSGEEGPGTGAGGPGEKGARSGAEGLCADTGAGGSGGYAAYLPSGESVEAKLRELAAAAGLQGTGGIGLGASLALPPPPPPPANPYMYQQPQPTYDDPAPLPNPMRSQPSNRTKRKKVAGIGRKEMEMLKQANFTDIITQGVEEGERVEFEYNTPLPFDTTDTSAR